MQNKYSAIRPEKEEFQLLNDKTIFLRKRVLAEKVHQLLGICASAIADLIQTDPNLIPEFLRDSRPKISKGENYLGYPWIVLDYPRLFNKEDIFAIRTLCWWGNTFSVTMHLGGIYANQYKHPLFEGIAKQHHKGISLCIHDDQWQHAETPENYCDITKLNEPLSFYLAKAEKNKFIKVARFFPLESWEEMPDLTRKTCEQFFKLIQHKS